MLNEIRYDALRVLGEVISKLDAMSKKHLLAMPEEQRNVAIFDHVRRTKPGLDKPLLECLRKETIPVNSVYELTVLRL